LCSRREIHGWIVKSPLSCWRQTWQLAGKHRNVSAVSRARSPQWIIPTSAKNFGVGEERDAVFRVMEYQLKNDHIFVPLRSEPRFPALMEQLGFDS
jgi:hypothetical protein